MLSVRMSYQTCPATWTLLFQTYGDRALSLIEWATLNAPFLHSRTEYNATLSAEDCLHKQVYHPSRYQDVHSLVFEKYAPIIGFRSGDNKWNRKRNSYPRTEQVTLHPGRREPGQLEHTLRCLTPLPVLCTSRPSIRRDTRSGDLSLTSPHTYSRTASPIKYSTTLSYHFPSQFGPSLRPIVPHRIQSPIPLHLPPPTLTTVVTVIRAFHHTISYHTMYYLHHHSLARSLTSVCHITSYIMSANLWRMFFKARFSGSGTVSGGPFFKFVCFCFLVFLARDGMGWNGME